MHYSGVHDRSCSSLSDRLLLNQSGTCCLVMIIVVIPEGTLSDQRPEPDYLSLTDRPGNMSARGDEEDAAKSCRSSRQSI